MHRLSTSFVLLVAVASASAAAEPLSFTGPPTVVREGDAVRIEFAVSAATDVAVAIEDVKGNVVRHLVAGKLGKNPPKPLKADSLSQSVPWDGTDDLGKAVDVKRGPFRVRVSLGLKPTFKQFVGDNPAALGGVRGMAVGPEGNVYVIHSFGSQHPLDGSAAVAVLSREGKYLRTIAPFPADIADERLKGLKFIRRQDGTKVPYVYQSETRSHLPGLGDLPSQTPIVTSDGRFAFVGVQEGPRPFAQPGEARLTVIRTDGGMAEGGVLQTLIHPLTDAVGGLALSPDEKTIYACGVRAGTHPTGPSHEFTCEHCDHRGSTWAHTIPVHCVFRFRWGDPTAAVYIGNPAKAGDDPKLLNSPVCVATDGDGNVYVADFGNDRIAVFNVDGRFPEPLAQIKIEDPQRVEVHRKTGAIYVLAGGKDLELVKFDGYKTGREVWRKHVYRSRRAPMLIRRPAMRLDDRVDPPVVWISRPLARIVDKGDTPGEMRNLWDEAWRGPPGMASVMEMSLDRRRGMLYVNNTMRYDVRTWKGERFKLAQSRMWPNSNPGSTSGRLGRDGNYYVHMAAGRARVFRFGPDLKPMPFPKATPKRDDPEDTGGYVTGYARDHSQGHTADGHGNVYVLWKKGPKKPGDHYRAYCLNKYGPDGGLLKEFLVDAAIPGLHSVRVDNAGNVYLAVAVRPGTSTIPPGLEGQVPDGPADPAAVNGINMYPMMYGSIIKFGPDGGEVRAGISPGVSEKVPGTVFRCNFAFGRPIDVKGAEWIVPGASLITGFSAPKRTPGTFISCVCESHCMDVDDFGRTFFPDAARARVGILDTAGNAIGSFGTYGNPDAKGLGSTIPLWWPQAVAVGDREAYVGDRLNRRIVVVRLTYAVETTCEVK